MTIFNEQGKLRTAVKLTATGIASPLIIGLLLRIFGVKLFLCLLMVGAWLGSPFARLVQPEISSRGWSFFNTLDLIIGPVFVLILIWVVLMIVVNVVEKYIHRKREQA